MDELQHFSHDHLLSLVNLQSNKKHENSDDDEDGDDFLVVDQHVAKCKMCKEDIYSFHLCYYKCKECNYSLHKFCAQLPTTLQDHSLHPGHNLTLSKECQFPDSYLTSAEGQWKCDICYLIRQNAFNYHCSLCKFNMDIMCATMSVQKMDHPCHPHQLERIVRPMVSVCNACGVKQNGTFYYCSICQFFIHLQCALLPAKLLIQQSTDETFTHSHPLTLACSFPYIDNMAKFLPLCRVCAYCFNIYLWLYKCDKCRYYVHVDCAISKRDPFMSIFLPAGRGKTVKNFEDESYPDLLNCPFPDESYNLLKHHLFKGDIIDKGDNGEMLNHPSHQHPLILFDKETSLVALHNPMKKLQLLCDGCVKPIMTLPFYKCCDFALHMWCATLPAQVHDHPGHPEHMLALMPNIPNVVFNVFTCAICWLPSNGFAYGCKRCRYYVDINCAFIPEKITHEAHPNHLLSRIIYSDHANRFKAYCHACQYSPGEKKMGFYCSSCDFYLHIECAFLLPRVIRHKFDKHPLSLRYEPVEDHINEYFCEICEDEMDPNDHWFYHCNTCVQSIHAACGPLILGCEKSVFSKYQNRCVFKFLNVKFGGKLMIKGHRHSLFFVQGVERDGRCKRCHTELQFTMIFKCFECEFALHHACVGSKDLRLITL